MEGAFCSSTSLFRDLLGGNRMKISHRLCCVPLVERHTKRSEYRGKYVASKVLIIEWLNCVVNFYISSLVQITQQENTRVTDKIFY